MNDSAVTFTCNVCEETFPLDPDFNAAAEYADRFGEMDAGPRADGYACDDCYREVLVTFGHCATCLNLPCSCPSRVDVDGLMAPAGEV